MDFFLYFILPITGIMSLLLILCLWLSIKFSRNLKSLRYASIISFVMVLGALIVMSLTPDMGEIGNLCFAIFWCPGFFIVLPVMCIFNVSFGGPCSEAEPFYYIFVGCFIFYTLLIFGILKFWQKFKKLKAQGNYNWRAWFE